MTEIQKGIIQEEILKIHIRDNWTCKKCGNPSTQIAHRIAKGKVNRMAIKRYIRENYTKVINKGDIDKIIHHGFNVLATCDTCNSSFNIGNNDIARENLIEKILVELGYKK